MDWFGSDLFVTAISTMLSILDGLQQKCRCCGWREDLLNELLVKEKTQKVFLKRLGGARKLKQKAGTQQ